MKKLICFLVICFIFFGININCVFGEENMISGDLYINSQKVSADTGKVLFGEDGKGAVLFPLRTILENLGAEIEWKEETGDIYVTMKGETYIMQFTPAYGMPENIKNVTMKNIKYITSYDVEDYIKLNPMSATGICNFINDRTYFYEDGMRRILNYFNYDIQSIEHEDKETYIVKI